MVQFFFGAQRTCICDNLFNPLREKNHEISVGVIMFHAWIISRRDYFFQNTCTLRSVIRTFIIFVHQRVTLSSIRTGLYIHLSNFPCDFIHVHFNDTHAYNELVYTRTFKIRRIRSFDCVTVSFQNLYDDAYDRTALRS